MPKKGDPWTKAEDAVFIALREEHQYTDQQISVYLGHRTAATIQARYSRTLQPSVRSPQDYSHWLPAGWTLAGASSMSHWPQPAVVGVPNAPRSKGRKATASNAGVSSAGPSNPPPPPPPSAAAAAAAAPPPSSSSGPKAKKSIAPKANPLPSAPTRVSARTRVPSRRAADLQPANKTVVAPATSAPPPSRKRTRAAADDQAADEVEAPASKLSKPSAVDVTDVRRAARANARDQAKVAPVAAPAATTASAARVTRKRAREDPAEGDKTAEDVAAGAAAKRVKRSKPSADTVPLTGKELGFPHLRLTRQMRRKMVPDAAYVVMHGDHNLRPLLRAVEPAEGVWDILPEEVRPDQSAPVERTRRHAEQPRLFPVDSKFVDDTRREAEELIRKGRDGEVGEEMEGLLWGEMDLGLGYSGLKPLWLPTAGELAKASKSEWKK